MRRDIRILKQVGLGGAAGHSVLRQPIIILELPYSVPGFRPVGSVGAALGQVAQLNQPLLQLPDLRSSRTLRQVAIGLIRRNGGHGGRRHGHGGRGRSRRLFGGNRRLRIGLRNLRLHRSGRHHRGGRRGHHRRRGSLHRQRHRGGKVYQQYLQNVHGHTLLRPSADGGIISDPVFNDNPRFLW